jgi:hypothetical protein
MTKRNEPTLEKAGNIVVLILLGHPFSFRIAFNALLMNKKIADIRPKI